MAEAQIQCPHCGQTFPLQLDTSQKEQSLVEDCSICCRPIAMIVHSEPGAILELVTSAG